MDAKIKANVDSFAQFLSDLADKYEMEHEDFLGIFRHISTCFGGIVVSDEGVVKEDKHEGG
jgi:hypothetical protein